MSKLAKVFKNLQIPRKKELIDAIKNFDKKRRIVFYILVGIFVASLVNIVFNVTFANFFEEVPSNGGTITEGVIGTPRFVNPVLALNNADKDVTALVYSGLTHKEKNGTLILDLADEYFVSDDGRTYTFRIHEDAVFHDREPVTAEDVVFTVEKIQDPLIKSPLAVIWDGVEVSATGDKTVVFKLQQPFSSFLESTSVGILPKHIWEEIDSGEFSFDINNIKPVGSGPFKVSRVKKDKSGSIEGFNLKANRNYTLGKPFLKKIKFEFFENEEKAVRAFEKNRIDSIHSISTHKVSEVKGSNGDIIYTSPLSRIFGIFLNQNRNSLFKNKSIRQAIDIGIDRQMIVDEVLSGFGTPINGPIPLAYKAQYEDSILVSKANKKEAINILEKDGWVLNEEGVFEKESKLLTFTLATASVPELNDAAEMLKKELSEIGILVEVKVFETSNLNQNVIRPRNYEALFFGQVINNEADLFAFWHSSQRNDPGLNIAGYKSSKVDNLLETSLASVEQGDRFQNYKEIESQINSDIPAIFVYSPSFVYATHDRLKINSLPFITNSSERFLDVRNWFVETNYIWKLFSKKQN